MTVPVRLLNTIRGATPREAPASVKKLIGAILGRYGDAVQAILFYGSCFRSGDDGNGIVDLYLVVDTYRHAYQRFPYALLNCLLPPNVFYLEVPYEGSVRRVKYSVFSIRDFQRGASRRWFQPYLWSRLAQPMGLVYARNNRSEEHVYTAKAQALLTFLSRVLPFLPPEFTSRDLWCTGLGLTYGTELRAERRNRLTDIYDAAPDYYETVTRAALDALAYPMEVAGGTGAHSYRANISSLTRVSSRVLWSLRRLQGKILSLLRLLKGLVTFPGGLDYVLWKIERHSGVTTHRDTRLSKIPLVGALVLFWRLYRRGAFR